MNEKSKYKIYIDTTDRANRKISLLDNADNVVEEIVGDVDVVSVLQKLLDAKSLDPSDIEIYDVNPGPGSFTGIKIGVTTVNVINWALGNKKMDELVKPVYGQEPNINMAGLVASKDE
jgi:tRNA A37 threonylcarbamoyladenosine modification protein TsaB